MSQTKLGPALTVFESDRYESHAFWFEGYKCSIKVDRRKDGGGLSVTVKTQDSKVVLSVGPQDSPHFVAQVKHSHEWSQACEYVAEIKKHSVKFRFDYEPPA